MLESEALKKDCPFVSDSMAVKCQTTLCMAWQSNPYTLRAEIHKTDSMPKMGQYFPLSLCINGKRQGITKVPEGWWHISADDSDYGVEYWAEPECEWKARKTGFCKLIDK